MGGGIVEPLVKGAEAFSVAMLFGISRKISFILLKEVVVSVQDMSKVVQQKQK